MSRVELNFVATGNFSQLKTQLDQVRRSVEQINKSSMGVGMSNDQMSRMKQMTAQYDKIVQSSGAFHRSVVQTQGVTEKFGQSLQNQTLKLGQYFDVVKRGSNSTQGSLRQLAEQQVRLSQSIMRTDPFTQGRVYVDTPRKINAIANATAIAKKQQELYNLSLRNGADELIKWGKNTQWAGRQLSVGLTLPIMMFGKQASETFLQFDKELVRMQKVYGTGLVPASDSTLKKIRSDVTGLSSELASAWGQSIDKTAAFAADLAATGLEGPKLLAATKEASRIAILGEVSQQDSVKTTISLQNVFKMSTQDLTQAMDFLIGVSNQSSLSLQDLTDSIPRAAPVVDELGGSVKDLAVMMAAMAEAGIPASEAANAIKSSMASLINPTKETKKSIKELGIDLVGLVNATGGTPVATFKLLAEQLNKLDKLSRARAIEQIFGKFQFARIAALLDNINSKGTQTARVFELMGASSGQLAALAASNMKQVTESASGRYQRAIESLRMSLVPIGEKFTEIFTTLMEFFSKITNFVNKNPQLLNLVKYLGLGTAIVGPLVMTAGLLGNFFGFLGKGLVTVKNLANGFRGFGKVATAESLAAANAAELFSEKMIKEAGSIDIVKMALSKLNLELQEYISLSKTGTLSGVARPPAGMGGAGAGPTSPAAPWGGTGAYVSPAAMAASNAAIIASLATQKSGRNLALTGTAQWTHAYPNASLLKPAFEQNAELKKATALIGKGPGGATLFPTTGIFTTGQAAALQTSLNQYHNMVTLRMSEAQAVTQRSTIFLEQAALVGMDPNQARLAAQNGQIMAQLYPSVETFRNNHVRFLVNMNALAEHAKTLSEKDAIELNKIVDRLGSRSTKTRASAVAQLQPIIEQVLGGKDKYEKEIDLLMIKLLAETDDVQRQIMMATMSAQAAGTRSAGPGRTIQPLKKMLSDTRGQYYASQIATMTGPTVTDDAAISKLLVAEKKKLLASLKLESAAAAGANNKFYSGYVVSKEQEIESIQQRVLATKEYTGKEVEISNAVINGKTAYIVALIDGKETLITLDSKNKVLEGSISDYAASMIKASTNVKELNLKIDEVESLLGGYEQALREESLTRKRVMTALRRQGLTLEEQNAVRTMMTQEELASGNRYKSLTDAAGNRLIQVIDSQGMLISAIDVETALRINGSQVEEMKRDALSASYTSYTAKLNSAQAKLTRLESATTVDTVAVEKAAAEVARLTGITSMLSVALEQQISATELSIAADLVAAKTAQMKGAANMTEAEQAAIRGTLIQSATNQQLMAMENVSIKYLADGSQIIKLLDSRGRLIIALDAASGAAIETSGAMLGLKGAAMRAAMFMKGTGVQMGAGMAGMGLSMAGMSMGNNAMMYGGMALSMAPLLSGLSTAAILATAAVAALAGLGAFLYKLHSDWVAFRDATTESFRISSVAAEHFGVSVYELQNPIAGLVENTKEATDSVNKLAEAYGNAADEGTKNFLEQIKNADPKAAVKLLIDRYQSDIIAGFGEKNAKEDIAAILLKTGRKDLAVGFNLKIDEKSFKDPLDAFQQRALELQTAVAAANAAANNVKGRSTKEFLTATSSKGVLVQNNIDISKAVTITAESYDHLTESMLSAYQTMPIENFANAMKSVFGDYALYSNQTKEQGQMMTGQFNSLVSNIRENVSPELADAMNGLAREGDVSFANISRASALMMRGVITDIDTFRKAARDPVYMDFIVRTYQDKAALSDIASKVAEDIKGNSKTSSSSSTDSGSSQPDKVAELQAQFAQEDKRKAEDEAIKSKYDKLADAQDKIIDKINKERDARRKLREEQQANNDFLLTEMGLKKQINEALASGDLAGADLLRQQLANEQDKKAADDKEKRITAVEDKKITAAEAEKKRIERVRDAEVKALEARRKAEDRAKQLSDAAKQSADAAAKSAKAQEDQQTAAGDKAQTVLQQIQDKLKIVYFSTPESALKDSLIAKLRDQLVAMGVPADKANQYIADLWAKTSKGSFDPAKFNALVESLKGIISETGLTIIVQDALNRLTNSKTPLTSDQAISGAMFSFYGSIKQVEAHQEVFNQVRSLVGSTPPAGRATGGPISGPGGPKDDRIPAMLSNGEYVIQADAVGHYGTGFFDAVNAKKYANGGLVMMGDSIMRDTDPYFTDTYAGRPVRKAYQGGITPTQAISKWGSSIKNWPNKIAVSLGTNGPGPYPTGHFEAGFNASMFDAEIEKVMSLAGTDRDVYWYTNAWNKAQKYNSTIAAVNSRHSNMHIVDVAGLIKSHPSWIVDDNGNRTSWSNMGKHPASGAYPSIAKLLMSRLGSSGASSGGSNGGSSTTGSGSSSSYPPGPWHSYVKYRGGNRDFPALMKWASNYAGQIDYAHKDSQGGYSDLAFTFNEAFKKGFGCSNFTHAVLKEIGMDLESFSPTQMQFGSLVTKDYRSSKMKPGDLVFWRTANGPQDSRGVHDPNHVAFYYGGGRILQSSGGRGVNISNIYGPNGTGVGDWGFLQARRLANTVTSTPTPAPAPRPRPTQPPTPSRAGTTANPAPRAPRAAGQIPFSAATGTLKATSDFSPMARNITSAYGMGGMVLPKYHDGTKVGYSKTGEVAALLQTGETVVTRELTDKLTPLLESIADGKMGMGDITNHIHINGANKSPEQIADIVINKINATMTRQIRTNRVM